MGARSKGRRPLSCRCLPPNADSPAVRGLGTSLILIAVIAVQVPFVTCHSDCRSELLPLWAFAGHHCHDAVPVVHEHVKGCPCSHTHPDVPPDGDDHEPGDHEIVFAAVATPPAPPSTAADLPASMPVALEETGLPTPTLVVSRVETPYLGPPGRPALETVRLLL